MATRVLSSNEAKAAITTIKGLMAEGMAEHIKQLTAQGELLSDPNVWDGTRAEDFRSNTWPTAKTALNAAATQIAALSATIEGINNDIMTAGGNA